MNTNLKNIFLAIGAVAIMASCGENAWNDHLDGFESGVNYNTAVDGAFTMSGTDYKAVASNATNIQLAGDNSALLEAVGKNGYFSAEIPAIDYLPAFLASSDSPYFTAPNKSAVKITYDEAGPTDPIIAGVAAAKLYTVSSADYQAAWKSDADFIDAFAPMLTPASALPAILKSQFADAQSGDYAVVTYNEAATNPIFIDLSGEKAIETIYSEPFNESQGKFEIYDEEKPEALEYIWKWGGANYGMKASAFLNPENYASESWLISPEINLEGSKASMSFDEACNFFADVETAKNEAAVYLRVNGGDWSRVTGYEFPATLSWTFVNSGEIDLSAYCGKTIQVAFRYTSTAAKSGTWEVKNFEVKAEGGSVGPNPGYWGAPRKKALINTPVVESKIGVYTYDGSKWAVADAVAVQPADYAEMGFAVNAMAKPQNWLPLFMKANFPYAHKGDMKAVVYNGTACSVMAYNGSEWSINDNGLQTLTALFRKTDGVWAFEKYMTSRYFAKATELVLDQYYLMEAEGIAATPFAASKTYGYIPVTDIKIVDGQIEQPDLNNALYFATSWQVGATTYEAPEGTFFIIDSQDRFLYMTGAYNSFNLAKEPTMTDGAVNDGFLYKAVYNEEGDNWTISNIYNEKWIQYSISFTSYGCYPTEQDNAALPSLYVLLPEE